MSGEIKSNGHDIWFTSDHHFGHKNIIEFEPYHRPFTSLDEMHETLVERWNKVVKPKDRVYHLGDFAFNQYGLSFARRLHGDKRLILGNHDKLPTADYLQYFSKLHGIIYWQGCILSHVPVHTNQCGARWLLNVHGHLHSKRVMSKVWDGKED